MALALYLRVRTDKSLFGWPMQAYDENQQHGNTASASTELVRLRANDPNRTFAGYGFRQFGDMFWTTYEQTNSLTESCQTVTDYVFAHPEAYGILNSYGDVNPTYTLPDLCPF